MPGFFHRNQRIFLIAITIIIIVSFIFLFNLPIFEYSGRNQLATINGKSVTRDQFAILLQEVRFDWELKNGQRLPAQMEDRIVDESWQVIILESQAHKLGINVTDDEVAEVIVRMPDFQTDGKFDESKYNQFCTYQLVAKKLNKNSLENIIKRQLLFQKTQMLLGSTAKSTPQEIDQSYLKFIERPVIQYIVLNKNDFKKQLKPYTDNELKAAFAEYSNVLKTGEERKVEYVRFSPTTNKNVIVTDEEVDKIFPRAQGKIPDNKGKIMDDKTTREFIKKELLKQKQTEDALDQANQFASKFVPDNAGKLPEFKAVVSESKIPIVESDYFFRRSPVKGMNNDIFNKIAFSLNPENPVSDPIPVGDNSFAVIHLIDVKKERTMDFDEAKAPLNELMIDQALNKLVSDIAKETQVKIQADIAAGKSFDQSVSALSIKPSIFNPKPIAISELGQLISSDISDEERSARQATANLAVNGVSEFIPTENGGIIAFLKVRDLPTDKTKPTPEFIQGYIRTQQNRIFVEWLTEAVNNANIPKLDRD